VEGAEELRLGAPRMVENGGPAAGAIVNAVETGCGVLKAALEMEGRICPP
jgi:hypothetical protein